MIAAAPAGALAAGQPVAEWVAALERRFATIEARVGAFVPEQERFARLAREAGELLARHPAEDRRPALFGVPVGVKDIFHVDGLQTRAGSSVPPAELAGSEAASVRRLRRAGALVLGKTVTTEFAYFAPRGTRNPADPERTPGGSSSGSAAAVAAKLCPLALGTQTIGSICRPASYCGVVGFKPSYERISRAGVIPLAPSVDHVGTFTPTVEAARKAAAVLIHDWTDETTDAKPRLGLPHGPYLDRLLAGGGRRFETASRLLVDRGLPLREVPALADFEAIEARHRLLVAAEAAAVHAHWYRRYGESYDPKTRELIETGHAVSADELAAARAGRLTLRAALMELMEREGVDVWVTPASQDVAPLGLESTGDPVMNLPWSQAGLPSIGLPTPRAAGELPFGLQLVGRWRADEQLLSWAAAIEEVLDG